MIWLMFLLVACAAAQGTHFKHGPTFGWRRGRKPYVLSAETTLYPGAPPSPAKPRLAVWPGMDTPGGLVQPIIVSTTPSEAVAQWGCRPGPGQWCVFSSYLNYSPHIQRSGKAVAMDGTEALRMKFTYDQNADGYKQELFIKGAMVSTITGKTGKAKGFYTDVECQGSHVGVISAHRYANTTIVLSEADPDWGKAPSNHMLACADKISSNDGGKTWVIPTIKVSESTAMKDYEGKNPPGPIICPA